MNTETMYLRVTEEPLLSTCMDWRRRHEAAHNEMRAFARSHGATGYFVGLHGQLVALTPVSPTPDGWKVVKPRRALALPRMVPSDEMDGDEMRAAIDALPHPPRHDEIATAIGHPCQVSWEGRGERGSSVMIPAVDAVQLFWAGDAMMIACPNAAQAVETIRAEHPGCRITQGKWTPPTGTTHISEAEANLAVAQARVADEQRQKAHG